MKPCARCKRDLPLEAYYKSASTRDGRKHTCRECMRVARGLTPQPLPKLGRSEMSGVQYWRVVKYGLTPAEYDEMWLRQEGRCAICRDDVKLYIDHCHKTGVVRGLLCKHCNMGIGHFRDEPLRLQGAIDYLCVFDKNPGTGR